MSFAITHLTVEHWNAQMCELCFEGHVGGSFDMGNKIKIEIWIICIERGTGGLIFPINEPPLIWLF